MLFQFLNLSNEEIIFSNNLIKYFCKYINIFKNPYFYLLQDIYDVEERMGPGGPGGSGGSNKIKRMPIYKNHLVRVQDLGLTWKLEFDITLFKQPAYDKDGPINIFHLTQNGNDDKDNIIKFSLVRQGSHGKFIFKYWTHTKTLLFSMGTPYHVIIELYRNRRGKKYEFAINVDDDDLVNEPLKDIQQVARAYKFVRLYCSNPWEKTLTSKIGTVKNFVIPKGTSRQCCKRVALVIKQGGANVKLQKDKVSKYIYKGEKNGRGYWESTDGQSAIWYYEDYREWMIGSKCYLGTKFRGISARQTSVSCPDHNHKRWSYWDGHKWLSDRNSQIDLVCIDNYAE